MSLNILVLCYTYKKEVKLLPYLRIYNKCLGDIVHFPWEEINSITLIGDEISPLIDPAHKDIQKTYPNIKIIILKGNIITFDFPNDSKYDFIINEHCPVFNIYASVDSFFDTKTNTYKISLDRYHSPMHLLRDKMTHLILNHLESDGNFISNGSEQLINYFLNALQNNNNYELILEREEEQTDLGKQKIEIAPIPRKLDVHPYYKHRETVKQHIKGYNHNTISFRSIYFVIHKKSNLRF